MNIVIPVTALKPETLTAVIEEFVTRHGAIHGHVDMALDRQVEQVRKQLSRGEALLIFNDEEGTCSICMKKAWDRATPEEREGTRPLNGRNEAGE